MKTFEVVLAFTDYILEVQANSLKEATELVVNQMIEDTEGMPQSDRMYVANVQEIEG